MIDPSSLFLRTIDRIKTEDRASNRQFASIRIWHEVYSLSVARAVDEIERGPAEQLKGLLRMVVTNELGRFEHVMVSLCARNPDLEPAVTRSFEFRRRYVGKLFVAMGFRADAARARASIVIGYGMSEEIVNRALNRRQRLAFGAKIWETLTTVG